MPGSTGNHQTSEATRLAARLRSIALITGGVLGLAAASLELVSVHDWVANALVVHGRVIALNAGPAHPEVELIDPEGGAPVRFAAGGFGVSHRIGDQVEVLLVRREGNISTRLNEPAALWGYPLITAATGAALLIAGLYISCRHRKLTS